MTASTTSPSRPAGRHALVLSRRQLRNRLADLAAHDAQLAAANSHLERQLTLTRGQLRTAVDMTTRAASARETYATAFHQLALRLADLEDQVREKGRLELANTALRSQLADALSMHQLGATQDPNAEEMAAGWRTRAETVEMQALQLDPQPGSATDWKSPIRHAAASARHAAPSVAVPAHA